MRYEIGQVNRLGNRSCNQDRFIAVETDEGVLLVLGDGMGGQAFGEVAAEILIQQARRDYLAAERTLKDVGKFLQDILLRSHHAINDFGQRQQPPVTPGTTGVLCLIQDGMVTWAHVGDSRLYLYQQGLPIYRTTDHSYVEELFQKGKISRWEQENHPQRNQITECLGVRPEEPQVTVSKSIVLKPGDILMLCSDGLWGPLDDALMGSMLLTDGDLEQCLDSMAEKAEQISYPRSDNISVLALRFISAGSNERHQTENAHSHTEQPGNDRLESAIAQIEEVLREYEKEIGR